MSTATKVKIGSFFIFALAVLFYAFFMHAKHDPALSRVNAFADDPYDAVGSFGIQAAAFLAILGLLRAFRATRRHGDSLGQERFVLRVQIAALLSVAVTLSSDALAMLRHSPAWMGFPAGYRLIELLAGIAVLTLVIGMWVRRNSAAADRSASLAVWARTFLVSLFAALVLLLYPENWRRGLVGVLFTALLGSIILFICVWAWATALVPDARAVLESAGTVANAPTKRKYTWVLVMLAGVLIGLFLVAGEASEGAGIPHSRLPLVISAYIGLETAGVLIGYGLLRRPLDLFRTDTK